MFGLFPLTRWNPEAELKVKYSWLVIGIMQALITVNMIVVLASSIHSLKLFCSKKTLHLLLGSILKKPKK